MPNWVFLLSIRTACQTRFPLAPSMATTNLPPWQLMRPSWWDFHPLNAKGDKKTMSTIDHSLTKPTPGLRKVLANPAGLTTLCGSFALILLMALAVSSCSVANREGPNVTCDDLQSGTLNACKEGIIAYCNDGKTVTYKVCTDSVEGTNATDLCEASWQVKGQYQCSNPKTGK